MPASSPDLLRRLAPWVLLAYVFMVLFGTLGRQAWMLRAAVPVLVLLLATILPLRRAWALALWLALGALLIGLDLRGQTRAVFGILPILINAALCVFFARTLRSGHEALVTRVVRVVEGEDRLAIPGVPAYTRAVTLYWAMLTGAQVLLLGSCWLLVLRAGEAAPGWARLWLHVGGYALPILAMLAEYAWRRWRFRGHPHLPAHAFMRRLVACWPSIVREPDADPRR